MSANAELLAAYRAAEIKILGGQVVQFGERSLRMADLEFVQSERRRLEAVVAAENAPRRRGPLSQADFSGYEPGACDWNCC